MTRVPRVAAGGALAALLLAAAPAPAALRVAATIAPIASLVREVGGHAVAVTTLLPPGASPHTFEPTTGAARALGAARVVFVVGAGLDAWAQRLVAAAAPGARVVDLSAGIELITGLAPDRAGAGGHDDGGGGRHGPDGGANPHYWLDPVLAAALADRIGAELAAAEPALRASLAEGARRTRERLAALDAEFRAALAPLPARRLVTFHDSWPYLARRYGLEVAGVIELAPGREPGPRHLAGIVATIRALGVPAVFTEPQLPARPAEVLAREAGVRVLVLDPLGGVPGRAGYVELMRANLRALVDGLGGGAP